MTEVMALANKICVSFLADLDVLTKLFRCIDSKFTVIGVRGSLVLGYLNLCAQVF